MDRRTFMGLGLGIAGGLHLLPLAAGAQESRTLTMAVATPPTSLDPHFQDAYISVQAIQQIFSALLFDESRGRASPNLATGYTIIDPVTWEVKLRQGVTFHDGTPFQAEDVVFSYERVPNVIGAAAPFTASVRGIERIEIVDAGTVRFHLKSPDPLFAWRLTQVAMLSRTIHANATTADFTSGKVAIGTGPYRYVGYEAGERLRLEAVPGHWWGEQAFEKVTIRYISDPGARLAALRSGDVDIVDAVPTQDAAMIGNDPAFTLFETPSYMTVFLFPDSSRDQTPLATDAAGKVLDVNPMKDLRVRRAISLAVDRAAVVARLMSGRATVADQLASPEAPDRASGLPALELDIEEAKKLMAEAGYADGFSLTVNGPNGFFANDANILQAVAQGLSRIGIKAQVDVSPASVFLSKATAREFSLFLSYFNSPFASIALQYLAMTHNPDLGNGSSNRQRYSNPEVDELMTAALNEADPERHKALVGEAMAKVIEDRGLIPILYLNAIWAGKADKLSFNANPMLHSSAFYARNPS